jgi:hypothetical protein
MAKLEKAMLQNLSDPKGQPIPVQFNPASLKLELSNTIEGGNSKGRQKRQYIGKSSTSLTFDLHFDTADQGTTDAPVSVRTLTRNIEQFLLPQGDPGTKQTAARVRFHWNELVFEGIIESTSIDFDLFAANGTPLRAKMGVTIKEQDARYQLLKSGPGANQPGNPTVPGAPGTGPGSYNDLPPNRSGTALAGESAADFASRMGLDPTAWRGIAAQLGAGSSLSLQAGATINFSSNLSAGAGVGISAGFEANAGLSLDASFGLDTQNSASDSAVVAGGGSAGFALAAAGGVGAAIETVAILQAQAAADNARRSFGSSPCAAPAVAGVNTAAAAVAVGTASLPGPSASAVTAPPGVPLPSSAPQPAMPEQVRTPLLLGGIPSPSMQESTPGAPPPPAADPRTTSFGLGVPLRPKVGNAADLRASTVSGRIPLRPRVPLGQILNSTDPTAAPWTQLPVNKVQSAADKVQAQRYPASPCG